MAGIMALSGTPGSWKTWLALEISLKVSTGQSLFNKFQTTQCGVLIIDKESGKRRLNKRLHQLGASGKEPIHISPYSEFMITEQAVKLLIPKLKKRNIKLIILDSFVRMHGSDENDATGMAKINRHLQILNANDIAVIFLHHHRKSGIGMRNLSQEMRGSSDILAGIDSHVAMICSKNEDEIGIVQTKARDSEKLEPFTMIVLENEDKKISLVYGRKSDESVSKVQYAMTLIIRVLRERTEELNKAMLWEKVSELEKDLGKSTFNSAIETLLEKNEITKRKGRGNATFFELPLDIVTV